MDRPLLLNKSPMLSLFLIMQLLAVIIVCCANVNCHRETGVYPLINVPPPPTYDSNLTSGVIECLLAGSVDPQNNLIAWNWVEVLIEHGNEERVRTELNNATAPNHKFRIQATFALYYLNDDPGNRITSILDMLINGSEIEKSNIRLLLPYVLKQKSDPQNIPQILELLTNDDPQVKMVVIETIQNFPDVAGVMQAIFESAEDNNTEVRSAAGGALAVVARNSPDYLRNEDGHRVLSQFMLNESWQGGKVYAYTAAAYCLEDPFIVSFLTERLQEDPDPSTREYILYALGALAPRELALPMLRIGLDDPDPMVRRKAEDILGITKLRNYWKVAISFVVFISISVISLFYFRRRFLLQNRQE
jgi:HEAT repeat protein